MSSIDPKWTHPKCLLTNEHINHRVNNQPWKAMRHWHITIWRTLKTLRQMTKSVTKEQIVRWCSVYVKGQEWQSRETETRLSSFQASLGVPGMFQAVGSSPHLLVDLDGFLVLLQLCSVGRHLQQTLVSRAESRTVQSKWQHWGDTPEATCFRQRCSDDRDELSFTTYEKPITDMKKTMYLLDSSPL